MPLKHLEQFVLLIAILSKAKVVQITMTWMKIKLSDILRKLDSHALVFLVLRTLSVLRYHLPLLNVRKPVLLLEWSQVITKSLLWQLLKNAKLLMNHSVSLMIALWRAQNSLKEWEV